MYIIVMFVTVADCSLKEWLEMTISHIQLRKTYTFVQLAEIKMNDNSMTAPAITDGMIYFRTQKYLIAVGKK